MVAVEHDLQTSTPNRLDVDDSQHRLAVFRPGILDRFGIPTCHLGRFVLQAVDLGDQFRSEFGVEDASGGIKWFQPVPLGRVVAGGDLQPGGGGEFSHQQPAGWCRGNPGIEHSTALGRQARQDRVADHQSAGTPITRDDDCAAMSHAGQCASEPREVLGFEPIAHDAAEAGDAENPGGHLGRSV